MQSITTVIPLIGLFLLSSCYSSTGSDGEPPAEPPLTPCEAYCQIDMECEPGFYDSSAECEADCRDHVEFTREEYSEDCAVATEELYSCLGGLTGCTQYTDYVTGRIPEYPCHEEDERYYSCVW